MPITRIHISGPPGSGKSTLARCLAEHLAVPHYDLDWIAYTERGERPTAERHADVARIAASPGWITEGAYSGWVAPLLRAAGAVIWLDMPWRVCVWRMVRRHAVAELRCDNPHPGWRRLFRFIGYTRGYFDSRRAAIGQTTWDAVAAEMGLLAPKVVHCRTSRAAHTAFGRLLTAERAAP